MVPNKIQVAFNRSRNFQNQFRGHHRRKLKSVDKQETITLANLNLKAVISVPVLASYHTMQILRLCRLWLTLPNNGVTAVSQFLHLGLFDKLPPLKSLKNSKWCWKRRDGWYLSINYIIYFLNLYQEMTCSIFSFNFLPFSERILCLAGPKTTVWSCKNITSKKLLANYWRRQWSEKAS